jgi:hypothetical protein
MTWFLTSKIITYYFVWTYWLKEIKIANQNTQLILTWQIVNKHIGKLEFETYSNGSENDFMEKLYD